MASRRHLDDHDPLRQPRLYSLDYRHSSHRQARRTAPHREAPARWTLELFGAAYDRLSFDNGDGLAAGLAFGALLSIAPLLLVVLAIASVFLGEGSARDQIVSLASDSLGSRSVPLLTQWIDDARTWSTGATVVGVVLFVFGSARLVSLVDNAFQMVFDGPSRAGEPMRVSIKRYFTVQLTAVFVTLLAGLLMVVSLLLRAVGQSWVGDDAGALGLVWALVRESLSFGFWFAALALVYRVLPPIRLDRGDILEGALVSAVLVSVTLLLLRVIASFVDFGAAYGAAGAVVGTLVALYVVSQLFLFGAEITAELAARRGRDVRSSKDGSPMRNHVSHDEPMRDAPNRLA